MTNIPQSRRPGTDTTLGNHERRLRALERQPPGRWVYFGEAPVGTTVGDPLCTPDSPPFLNGWESVGSGLRRLRIRRKNDWAVDIAGAVTGGVVGTVVANIAAFYRPAKTEYAVGSAGEDGGCVWKLEPNGDLSIVGVIVGVTVAELVALGFLKWGSNTDADSAGLVLTTPAGVDIAATLGVTVAGDPITLTSAGGSELVIDSAVTLTTPSTVSVTADNGVNVTTNDSAFIVSTSGGQIDLNGGTDGDIKLRNDGASGDITITAGRWVKIESEGALGVELVLAAGAPFTVTDSLGNPMLQMTEGSPDLHIPVGGTVIADL